MHIRELIQRADVLRCHIGDYKTTYDRQATNKEKLELVQAELDMLSARDHLKRAQRLAGYDADKPERLSPQHRK